MAAVVFNFPPFMSMVGCSELFVAGIAHDSLPGTEPPKERRPRTEQRGPGLIETLPAAASRMSVFACGCADHWNAWRRL